MKSLCLFILVIAATFNALAADSEIDAVRKILKSPRRDWSKWPSQEHAEDLKPLGEKAIPLLASLLEDFWLGYEAAETMRVIDSDKAMPLILASMPKSDRNVQFHTFTFLIRRINEGGALPFSPALHDAAKRCLEAGTCADAAEVALLVIGLSGSDSDFPLLERYYIKNDPRDVWGRKLRDAAEAALARLGHQKYLKNIETELAAPVPTPLAPERAGALESTMMKAGFSQNSRFIAFLKNHLHDPPADIPPSDVSSPDPAGAAKIAIYEIENHTSSGMDYRDIDFGKLTKWWEANRQKFE